MVWCCPASGPLTSAFFWWASGWYPLLWLSWVFVASLSWAHPAPFSVVECLSLFSNLDITWFLFWQFSLLAYLSDTVVPCSLMSHYGHSFRPIVKAVLIAVYCLHLHSSVGCFSAVNRTPGKKLCLHKLTCWSSDLIQCHGMLQVQRLVTLAWANSSSLEQPFLTYLCVELTSCDK